jgi:hypothetical protein
MATGKPLAEKHSKVKSNFINFDVCGFFNKENILKIKELHKLKRYEIKVFFF